MPELLAELTGLLSRQRPCVWCAVVETRGSTPQKAGAAMVVFADGGQRGTLGGGCVEAEVKQRALGVLADGHDAPPGSRFLFDDAGRFAAARGPSREVPDPVFRHLPDLSRRPGP